MRLRVPEGKEFQIHGRLYKAGEEFDAPDKEGALWKATGLATEVAEELPLWRETKAMKAERHANKRDDAKEETGRYSRKDMRAED